MLYSKLNLLNIQLHYYIIITNITGYCIKSGVLYNDISDHFPVFNVLQIDSKTTKKV